MIWYFCVNTSPRDPRHPWPRGSYCVFAKNGCPNGFRTGTIKLDDEDISNRNRKSGTLPDGVYDRDTLYRFCCRSDAPHHQAIPLPSAAPFILFQPQGARACQQVSGMRVSVEWFKWDCEDSNNRNERKPFHPRDARLDGDVQLIMCYYH